MNFFSSLTIVALILFCSLTCLAESPGTYAPPDNYVEVEHKFEYNSTDNPNGYNWCGHTALSITANAVTGVDKNIDIIHNIFWNNSSSYRGRSSEKYFSTTMDLYWAASLSRNNGYARTNTVIRKVPRTSAAVLQKVKDAVDLGWPVIIFSNYFYPIGHCWVIVGYKDGADADNSILYMRDVALSIPDGTHWDKEVKFGTFLHYTNHSGKVHMLIIK